MQVGGENSALFKNLIESAKKILILVGKNPSVDNLAAAFSLEQSLSAFGKNVQIYASGEIPEVFSDFTAKITDKIEVKKLVVSFNWHKNEIEKVSYSLEGENFNFIINPKSRKIEPADLKISYQGEEADLIIAIGIEALAKVGEIGSGFFENKTVVNFDKNPSNQLFGRLNFVETGADSVCTIVAKMLENSKLSVTAETVDVLLLGLRATTNNFEAVTDPTTFEVAAFCLRIKKGEVRGQKVKGSTYF